MNKKNTVAHLLDCVMKDFSLKNDAALSRFMGVNPPVISKLRNNKIELSSGLILLIHDKTDMPIKEIRSYMAQ